MSLSNKGLTKLTEECGELIQILQKKVAYPNTDIHPDDKGSMRIRMEEEIADVMAAMVIVRKNFDLDKVRILHRMVAKIDLLTQWQNEP